VRGRRRADQHRLARRPRRHDAGVEIAPIERRMFGVEHKHVERRKR